MQEIQCPTCKKQALWQNNKYRPFCSEICKLIDLGRWADNSYSIPGSNAPNDQQEEEPD